MNILAIDIGSYSIKIMEVRPERKNLLILEKKEIILDDVKSEFPSAETVNNLQREIVADFIHKKSYEVKIIFQVPNDILTTRYLDIPGTSKRKAEQIIPFQLDENLPYSLSNAHYSSRLHKRAGGFSVLSNITQLNVFKDFFSFFENKEASPSVLTSEISVFQAYVDHIRMNDTCCILDLGHKTTKAYFVQGRQIVSNHTSFVAGNVINEIISKTYQISHSESVTYKHENAFLLTDEQLDKVSNEQREFALLMKQIFMPLILDLKRWEIGHRVKYGTNIDKIFIIGGSSSINGLDNFLHFHTGLPIEFLHPLVDFKNDYSIHDKQLHLVKIMAISQKTPGSVINFLINKFQIASNSFISIHSATFIIMRSMAIALFIILGLFIERFTFLNKQEKTFDSKILGLLKTPSLEISRKDQKNYLTKPETVLASLKKKNKVITDEVKNVLSSTHINALKPLAILSKAISNNPKVKLEKFKNDGIKSSAVISFEDSVELEAVKSKLSASTLSHFLITKDPKQNILNIEFSERD